MSKITCGQGDSRDAIWVDGRLDLLVTFSHKYSYHPRQVFLSSGARSDELVAEVARYERFAE